MNQSFINASRYKHKTLKNADGTPREYRRNGKTQLWKTRPGEFRIPVKRGLREYNNITELNASEFEAV